MDYSIINDILKWINDNQALTGIIFGVISFIGVALAIVWRIKDTRINSQIRIINKLFGDYDCKFRSIPSIEELLNKALTEIEHVSKTDYNQIILDFSEKHSSHLYVVADAIPANKQRYDIVIYDGLIGKAYKTGDTIVVNDISKMNDYFNAVSETKSEISVPIKFDNHIMGVINSESEIKNYFSEDLQYLLDGIAKALAKNLLRLGWKKKPEYNDLVRIKRVPLNIMKDNIKK
jgi:transcriptional regulator with GAF, ATPase, and Fis domain